MKSIHDILSKKNEVMRLAEGYGFQDIKLIFGGVFVSDAAALHCCVTEQGNTVSCFADNNLEKALVELLGCAVWVIDRNKVQRLAINDLDKHSISINDGVEKILQKFSKHDGFRDAPLVDDDSDDEEDSIFSTSPSA